MKKTWPKSLPLKLIATWAFVVLFVVIGMVIVQAIL